ncbi:hypothetical protein A2903_01015 [Candidatus Nomurabacteria bacterium RIFCSPLOWO2_01_FULL_33_17]|uniref:Capsule synthesis protein CapA domain-containing protein n=1 Tax=Candidatus Nomurabacteria bacterium RIFCSPLOWO2_01_FULL_33_17 TaxID=1801764 RepID=A0A1F6WPR2_9BACT|nr:MAG: hypothetical protein A2903_01015 [Candidatus Nomurabacteria bacterium RIFCSPLOWO2_01_FULL_33_17]
MKKILLSIFITLIFGSLFYWVFFGGLFSNVFGSQVVKNNQNAQVLEPLNFKEKEPDYVVLTFAGDVMFDRGVKGSVNKNFNGDLDELFKNVRIDDKAGQLEIFQNDDISFLNLEGPVSDVGHNVGSIYSFRMNPTVISLLKNLGIDIVSFANNHVGDYTTLAFSDTLNRLTSGGILFTGAGENYLDAQKPQIIENNNIKVCYLGFSDVGPDWMQATEKSPGILLASDPDFENIIKSVESQCDTLIVSIHWGEEYQKHNARQTYLAHLAIDNGADIIAGHHPHVVQDIEIYKDKVIIYSLGNFMFDQYFSAETMQGLIVQLKVYKTGEIKDIKQYTSQQNKLYQIESITEK